MKLLLKAKKWIDVWLEFNNPYYFWWPFRKYVKRPKASFYLNRKYSWFYGLPINPDKPHIYLSGLGWKTKFDMVRWEWNPYFSIYIPHLFHFLIIWGYENVSKVKHAYIINLCCWENMLDLNYNDNISEKNILDKFIHGWTVTDKNGKHSFNSSDCLKKKYRELLLKSKAS